MKTIIEDNYLGNTLEIQIDSANRCSTGTLFDECPWGKEPLFSVKANCNPSDKFSEVKAIKLIKLKIAREWHKANYLVYKQNIASLKDTLKEYERMLDFSTTKLKNIDSVLEREFEITVYGNEYKPKVVKKTAKKTIKNSPKKKTVKKGK